VSVVAHAHIRSVVRMAAAAEKRRRKAAKREEDARRTESGRAWSNGTGPRPRSFRGALPVVPATCGECEHVRFPPYGEPLYGYSCGRTGQRVDRYDDVPPACPIRAELAKAGGA